LHARFSVVLAVLIASASQCWALTMKEMQGAWVMDGTDCGDVFEKKGDEIRFKETDSSLDTGLIVTGDKVQAATSTCTVAKLREESDHFSVLLNCADTVLSSSASMSFRMVDATHFERFDPSFPDFSIGFSKCSF